MYIMLVKVYYSSVSAVAACAFNRPVINLLRLRMNRLNGQYLLSGVINKKEKHEKYIVEVHNGKYST